ncbi:MAG: sigma-70 family RNA polymerase sigma factor [Candidatus Magnetomorum sp.]|nr:sigma-70 family RNA polymerase sigma factor [Candidatus Magnetomorum sp.]
MKQKEKDIQLLKDCIQSKYADPFVHRYWYVIENTIYAMANKRHRRLAREDVEDLRQTALIDLFQNDWKRLKEYKESRGMSVTSWVVLLTHHSLWPYFEKFPPHETGIDDLDEASKNLSVDDLMIVKEKIRLFMDSLTPKERLIFKLKYFKHWSTDAIAKKMRLKPVSVYKIIAEVKKRME